jgi:hypothetical protein
VRVKAPGHQVLPQLLAGFPVSAKHKLKGKAFTRCFSAPANARNQKLKAADQYSTIKS